MNQFPPIAPEYPIRTVSNFLENSQRYSQVKVHHRYQQHRRQIFPPVSLVLLITRWQIFCQCQRHHLQIGRKYISIFLSCGPEFGHLATVMRLRGLSNSSRGHFFSLLHSASTQVFSADLAYLTPLLFLYKYEKLLKTVL